MRPTYAIHEVDTGDFSVRSVLLQGSRLCLVWDTLTHPRDMAAFAEACHGRPCLAAYSHADWDHIQGTGGLASPLIVAHAASVKRFAGEALSTLEELRTANPEAWAEVRLIPPDMTFHSRLDLHLGGLTVELHALPGHTPDSVVAFVPQLRLLLAGDAVELPCPCVPPDCGLDEWMRGLEEWRAHPGVQTVIPSHGPCGGPEIIADTLAYLQALARGRPQPIPVDASAFYASTHRDNVRNCNITL